MKLFTLYSFENVHQVTERLRGGYLTHIYLFYLRYFFSSFIYSFISFIFEFNLWDFLVSLDCIALNGMMAIELKSTWKEVVMA